MIKEIVVYECDGVRFDKREDAEKYEVIVACAKIIETIEDKSDAMVKLINLYNEKVNSRFVDETNEYRDGIFKFHKPCALSCSLARLFDETCGEKCPIIPTLYYNIMEEYIKVYGEPGKLEYKH